MEESSSSVEKYSVLASRFTPPSSSLNTAIYPAAIDTALALVNITSSAFLSELRAERNSFRLFEKAEWKSWAARRVKCFEENAKRTAARKRAEDDDDDDDGEGGSEALREWNFPICKVINNFPNGCLIYVLQNTR